MPASPPVRLEVGVRGCLRCGEHVGLDCEEVARKVVCEEATAAIAAMAKADGDAIPVDGGHHTRGTSHAAFGHLDQ